MSNSDIRESGTLDLGVEINGVIQRHFTLRPATLTDTYRAAASVVIPADIGSNESALVSYQMALDDAVILYQLESDATDTAWGQIDPSALASRIDPDDMAILRQAAANLKKKWRQSRLSFPPIVEPNTCSSTPDSV